MLHVLSYCSIVALPLRRLSVHILALLLLSCCLTLLTPLPACAQPASQSSLTPEQKKELAALEAKANTVYEKGDYQAALSLFQQAWKRAEELKSPAYIGTFLNSLGNVYNDLGQKDKALDFLNQALDLYRKNNAPSL